MHDVVDQCNRPGPDNYANGYKPKTVLTRLGELTFQVPQVRCGDFYPSAPRKKAPAPIRRCIWPWPRCTSRSSTRRVIEVLQGLLGPEISLSTAQVSRAAARLDEGLAAWRERPLGEVPYLFWMPVTRKCGWKGESSIVPS